jgi:crossover junction endodeoxyribonuclease RuvC
VAKLRILAIDPGSMNLGWVYMEDRQIVQGPGTIKLWGGGDPRTYLNIHAFIQGHIRAVQPDIVALESYFPHRQRGAVVIPELRGIIKLVSYQLGLDVIEIAPSSVKKTITGNGRADKDLVRRMVNEEYGLSLSSTDEADAIAIAITAFNKMEEREGDIL